jgi:hypothetical protein
LLPRSPSIKGFRVSRADRRYRTKRAQAGRVSDTRAVLLAGACYWHRRRMENTVSRRIQVLIRPVSASARAPVSYRTTTAPKGGERHECFQRASESVPNRRHVSSLVVRGGRLVKLVRGARFSRKAKPEACHGRACRSALNSFSRRVAARPRGLLPHTPVHKGGHHYPREDEKLVREPIRFTEGRTIGSNAVAYSFTWNEVKSRSSQYGLQTPPVRGYESQQVEVADGRSSTAHTNRGNCADPLHRLGRR